ncbi:MAG: DUF3576 domain-containing protein [Rhodospirillales bacterium]|nr:DUF3576 domain-containing protein [Rhodospirillales bacterium]
MTGPRGLPTAAAAALLLLAACGGVEIQESHVPDHFDSSDNPVDFDKRETVFGEGGLFGGNAVPGQGDAGGALGVNAYLWRASLDTVSVWPIASADPFGGVIITDWHSPEAAPSERFKMNVFILGRQLRADGLRVSLFRQTRDSAGNWRDASTRKDSSVRLEEAILTRARQLRNQTATR